MAGSGARTGSPLCQTPSQSLPRKLQSILSEWGWTSPPQNLHPHLSAQHGAHSDKPRQIPREASHQLHAPGLTCQEGQKLAAGPLHPEGQGDGGQLLDAVEAELTREQKRRGMSASPDGTRNHMCVKVPNSNLVTPTK